MEIYILESLNSAEILTGREVYNDLLRWEEQKRPELTVKYEDINSKEQFFFSLTSISENSNADEIILQIDVHGLTDRSGLILKSDEIVAWDELKPILHKIQSSRGKLHLIMASCYGNYIGQLVLHGNLPFTSFTGTEKTIKPAQLVEDYNNLYSYIIQENDFLNGLLKLEDLNIKTSMITKYSIHLLEILIEKFITEFPMQNNLDMMSDMLLGLFEVDVRHSINKPIGILIKQDIYDAVQKYLKELE